MSVLRKQIQNVMDDKITKYWIKIMDWCSKYWGCHQLPERSFFLGGYQFPVCARCTGIIIGYVLSLIYAITFNRLKITTTLILLFPLVIDGTLQFFTNYLSTNPRRCVTGILAGFGFIQFIKTALIMVTA